ncbi:efflux RND transporter permease subunit [Endozoicomonas sp. 8E]|uniref:efflux RND transporter permease subunit n=1 Tax=Endozoicomonas sp. 8E TaxID=3035692 RepID=UPI002939277C|nr:efflux RND transporter permease subunit [Endozoicomonas sp. 8E]WOG30043.1 efflux RND transporter permease subunit [Endozoicomonas sp. 8E]
MNIAEYSIRNKVISWMFVVLLLIGGTISFFGLGKLEFPEFPIPQAMVNTAYPGASPQQVEEEVTLPLERAILEMEYVKNIDSVSSAGLSQIMIELKDEFTASDQPQIWDELRSKVNDTQSSMPPGVLPSSVNDNFSDVFGIMLSISGRDFNYRELESYGDFLQRELSLVDGVKKVSLAGTVDEQVVIEISQPKAAALGVDPAYIFSLIQNQNVVSNAGKMFIDGFSVRIHPTGEFRDISELKQLLVSSPGTTELIYLGDIADVHTTFDDTPQNLYRSNGEQAISLGISFAKGVNVVDVGDAVNARLAELESSRPVGIDVTTVYDQPEVVRASVNGFLISLAEAIAIVIVVLLFAMGLRSGLLMGGILLLTILGTFIGMNVLGVDLQLISLGALIIALGMLVDNAIVVTEGVLVGLHRGLSRMEAIKQVVVQNQWPLLGATVIAIIAFAPIGLSPDTTGDFMVSLFQVLLLSLMISWVLAITLTPFFCHLVFKEPSEAMVGSESDPYKGALFSFYRWFLNQALKHRIISLLLTMAALATAIVGFGYVKQSFFPPSNTPIFFVDVWMQEGSDIRATEEAIKQLEQDVLTYEGVVNVTSVMGRGAQRFILTYAPEKSYSSYGQLIIEVDERDRMKALIGPMEEAMNAKYPGIEFKFKLLQNGPSPAANIEARFYGSDPVILRELGAKAMAIMEEEPSAADVRQSWREQVTIARPQFDEAAGRRSGISKQTLDEALLVNFTGKQVGVYRDGSHLLPIIARAPEEERLNANTLTDLQVWSQERSAFVPVAQVVSSFESATENPLIVRRNLKRVLTVMADARPFTGETPESVRLRLKDTIESISLPEGYTLEWGGEFEMSSDAQGSIFKSLPMGYLIMFIITVLLFSTVRQPLAIWFTVPLGVIGVSAGLLLLNMPFTFTALLGLLSLSGMLIKNGIVLVEQINIEEEKTGDLARSIVDASVSRVRPVCMAALTTMLGMIPLVFDAFFSSMAVTIIFGLGFATVLTLIVLPVTYSLLYRVRFDG